MSHTHTAAAAIHDPSTVVSSAAAAGGATVSAGRVAAVSRLRLACGRFGELASGPPERALPLLHETAIALHAFATAITACEQAGLTRDELAPQLQDVRALHGQSPLVHRLQAWPRGYAGDFETVEWLCDARNRATAGTVPWAIEQCALQSPVAQQHRNKVGLQARTILATLVADPHARIASIGCGGCRDLSLIQEYVPPAHGTFVLVDADADALAFARQRLDRLDGRCRFVQGRVPRVLGRLRDHGGFHLIVAGGLFDYLPDRWAVATLTAARALLVPGGRVLFSNIARGNPFRPWIEYLADWHLIERTEADIRRLLAEAGFRTNDARVFRDSTELALLADATR
jgi:extracellular factor (EF) 3-hydroxypalmitic acid methyl ester biosynthesis protein